MSAIGFSKAGSGINEGAALIGAHADFQLEDYFFSRTQSRSLRRVRWQSRVKPMHSWGEFVVYGVEMLLGALAVLALFW
jgi:hypothetical protein